MRNLLRLLSGIPYMWWVTFLLLSRFSVFRQFDYNVSHCGFPWLILSYLKSTELFGGLYACLSPHLRCFHPLFFQAVSLLLSLSLSSRIPTMHMLICLMLSHRSFRHSFPFSSIFFFLPVPQLDNFNCPIFKVADSSAYSNLLLNPSSQFYFSYVFKLQNFLVYCFLSIKITILFMHQFCDFVHIFF